VPAIPKKHLPQGVQANMTPMIDVVFLLIVFFMLVSRIASEEVAQEVDLPEIYDSQAKDELPPQRVLVNLLWVGENREPEYRLGAMTVRSLNGLEARLKASKRSAPDLHAVIRSDRKISYIFVRKVLECVANAQIEVMHLALVKESD